MEQNWNQRAYGITGLTELEQKWNRNGTGSSKSDHSIPVKWKPLPMPPRHMTAVAVWCTTLGKGH